MWCTVCVFIRFFFPPIFFECGIFLFFHVFIFLISLWHMAPMLLLLFFFFNLEIRIEQRSIQRLF